jgi:hypothetical protein
MFIKLHNIKKQYKISRYIIVIVKLSNLYILYLTMLKLNVTASFLLYLVILKSIKNFL